jgi:hypothetical protein
MLWPQFEANKLASDPDILWSIEQYKHNREALGRPHPEDWSIPQAGNILLAILRESIAEKNKENLLDRHFKLIA